jgi:hypothetical protein
MSQDSFHLLGAGACRCAPARSASARPMVMSGVPASNGRCTPARPASHVWNAYPISGAAPEVNHRTSCRGSRGSASHRLI